MIFNGALVSIVWTDHDFFLKQPPHVVQLGHFQFFSIISNKRLCVYCSGHISHYFFRTHK